VERLPYDQVLRRYDRPETLFFIDPPYLGTEHYYGEGLFSSDDHQRLADQLGQLKGQFILTINDCPQARAIFRPFRVSSKGLHYGVGGGAKTKRVRELIVQGGGC
jgi:DNA adenine methylase